jgi:hypothetical protein
MIGDHDVRAARYGGSAIEAGIAWRSRISAAARHPQDNHNLG